MKKTFQVNINGKVFYIDEDAYELLLNYLSQLKEAFSTSEGEEIVNDIEGRIAELFEERIAQGATVITYSNVNSVIEIMGKPSDISDNAPSDNGRTTTIKEEVEIDADTPINTPKKKLYRNTSNKVLGGVLSGIATYLDWDVTILRLLVASIAILTYLWPLTLIYLVAWMIIPPANTPRRVLEMKGEEVTVNSIGKTILSSTTPPPYHGVDSKDSEIEPHNDNILGRILSFIGKCVMGFLGIVGALGAIVATVFTLLFLVAVIAATGFDSFAIISWFSHGVVSVLPAFAFLALSMCFILPCIALAWLGAAILFNAKAAAKSTIFLAIALETLFIVITVVLFIYLATQGWY